MELELELARAVLLGVAWVRGPKDDEEQNAAHAPSGGSVVGFVALPEAFSGNSIISPWPFCASSPSVSGLPKDG
ncbi:hypothetical protein QQS21_008866 [Conoideocrella luteorostrata]|uniref:Uncharacterized protein n=1 Tax=Conoideocrella luteorostrata TaxID=1105319 RepID=A0AAJ0FYA8_9HYPO|nr:hypothetical protein QQS21_008866 [Conoideocrella luteorostrata]